MSHPCEPCLEDQKKMLPVLYAAKSTDGETAVKMLTILDEAPTIVVQRARTASVRASDTSGGQCTTPPERLGKRELADVALPPAGKD